MYSPLRFADCSASRCAPAHPAQLHFRQVPLFWCRSKTEHIPPPLPERGGPARRPWPQSRSGRAGPAAPAPQPPRLPRPAPPGGSRPSYSRVTSLVQPGHVPHPGGDMAMTFWERERERQRTADVAAGRLSLPGLSVRRKPATSPLQARYKLTSPLQPGIYGSVRGQEEGVAERLHRRGTGCGIVKL